MAGQAIDWGTTVPIYDPDGNLRAIPQTQMKDALAQPGAKRAVPMLAPDGKHHWIGEDDVRDAVKAGGTISFPTQEIPKWFGFTPGNVASNIWQGVKGTITTGASLAKDLINNPNWFEGSNSTYEKFIGAPAAAEAQKASQLWRQGRHLESAGHELAGAIPLVGPGAASLGEQAGRGDVGGAVGQAAGAAATGEAIKSIPRAARAIERLTPSKVRSGAGLNKLTDSPNAAYANHPIDTTKTLLEARRIDAEHSLTGDTPPDKIAHYLSGESIRNPPPEILVQAKAAGFDPSAPMTMYEARTILKRVNEEAFDPKTPKMVADPLKRFAGALDQDITEGARQGGFLGDYQRMQSEYARGKGMIRAADKYGPPAGAVVGALAGRALLPEIGLPPELAPLGSLAGEVLGGSLGMKGGKSLASSVARTVFERKNPSPPQLRSLPATPAAHLRTLLEAKEGRISPGEADRRITRMGGRVKIRPIPQDQD